jgi:hypothetical protein
VSEQFEDCPIYNELVKTHPDPRFIPIEQPDKQDQTCASAPPDPDRELQVLEAASA